VSKPSTILGPDGRPVSAERVKLEKQSRFNPLRGWTPDVLVRQLEAYSRGEIAALAWVMEWLEKHDDVISTVAPKAKAAVSRWGYDVLPKDEITPEQKPLAEKQQAVLQAFFQFLKVSDAVELEESGGMRLLVQQIMDAYGKGYAAHHIIWMPTRGQLNAELVKVPTWFFEVTTGKMKFLPTYSAQRGVDLETLGGRNAWMISKGRGVMLAGVLARMFKQIPLQDWLTYCDRHGMPAFLGKTTAQKGSTGWTDMAEAVATMGSEFGAVINQGDMIDVLNLATQGEVPYVKLIDRMDRAQVRLWRGGDLSTMAMQDGVGSNPQQEDSDELDADNSAWVSETINRNLTAQVIAWHFGKNAPVLCELILRTKTRDNLQQEITIVEKAKTMGVRISKSWFTNKFGIVEADADEEALGETQTTALNAYNPLQARNPKGVREGGQWVKQMESGSLETNQIDADYLAAVASGDLEKAQEIFDKAAFSAGYDLSHYRGSESIKDSSNVVLLADWNPHNPNIGNDHYGDSKYLAKSSDFPPVPKWAVGYVAKDPNFIQWAKDNGGSAMDAASSALNPPKIIESAGFWDNRDAVSNFWFDNYDSTSRKEVGFKTPDGAVIFDPVSADEKQMIISAEAVIRTKEGSIVPVSQRFPKKLSANKTTAANIASSPVTDDRSTVDQSMQALRTALAADMQPIGKALEAAYRAKDLPAIRGALKKISASLPDLTDAAATEAELVRQMADAYLGVSTPMTNNQ
jgi:phage gp29-like protein